MEEKRTFWIVAIVAALVAVSASVAYFVTKMLRKREEDEYGDFFDCDCDDYCDDGICDCCEAADAEQSEEAGEEIDAE